MKRNHPITPQMYKRIKEEAAKLPEMHVLGPDRKPLMKKDATLNFSEKQGDGKIRNNITRTTRPVTVNHENEMVIACKKIGEAAIDIYIGMIKEINTNSAAMKFMRPIMEYENQDCDKDGFDKEWVDKIAPHSNLFFEKNPHYFKDEHVEVICNRVINNAWPLDQLKKYAELTGMPPLIEVLAQFHAHILNPSPNAGN